jgi:carboxymethylenebutenolidase
MTETQPDGYLATPGAGSGPGVLVLHAWWGLNETIRGICDRLAAAGFTAFAPDLYHGKVVDTIPDAEKQVKALNADFRRAIDDVAQATDFLAARAADGDRGLAVMGFSLGAAYALEVAAAEPVRIRAVVLFYGAGDADCGNSRAAFLGHFAENDAYEEQEYIDAMEESLRGAGRPVTFHTYEGVGHWFFEPDRPDAYNQEAAELAWERTLAFLKDSLAS